MPDELKWQSALICTVFIVLTSQYSQFPYPTPYPSQFQSQFRLRFPFPFALFWLKWNTLSQLVRVLVLTLALTFRLILTCSLPLLFLFIYFEHNANNFVIIWTTSSSSSLSQLTEIDSWLANYAPGVHDTGAGAANNKFIRNCCKHTHTHTLVHQLQTTTTHKRLMQTNKLIS